VHAGVAISQVDEAQARRVLDELAQGGTSPDSHEEGAP
jgi:hydrogenase maturation factor